MRASLLTLTVGALAVLFACSMTWSTVTVPMLDDLGGPVRIQSVTGLDLAPLAAAAAWVGLAGLLAVIATKSWGRVAVGIVVLAAGGLIVAASVLGAAGSSTGWWLLALGGGVMVAVSGGVIAARGRSWSGLSRRYESPAASLSPIRRQLAPWDAIDRGEDPTNDEQPAESDEQPA